MSKKESALKVIKELTEEITEANDEDVGDVVVLLKIKGQYVRYSTKIDDTLKLVGFVETLKHDVLKRMSS
ncbi:MAG: hypothetical protein VW270_00855 [Candidatus Poseidoniales archaeon]|jgi:hypothetical protein|tara:strand:- start:11255 stop:11464 length:210 start_codon:yes stop_codon:yes gene_type:complete